LRVGSDYREVNETCSSGPFSNSDIDRSKFNIIFGTMSSLPIKSLFFVI